MPAHIRDEGQLGAIEEVQRFQLPIIKGFLKIGWRRRLAGALHDSSSLLVSSSTVTVEIRAPGASVAIRAIAAFRSRGTDASMEPVSRSSTRTH